MIAPPNRPDPDRLLASLEAEQARNDRGKLKLFFGASPGVGKTYAMLNAARLLRQQGVDVVVGIVETHGRAETAALLEGFEILPPRSIDYRGRTLHEFDLDGALVRHPALVLVDELAHSNVAGSKHPKRWQDVIELLDAGIDVYSTLNVQHLESLNNVVGGITGTRVWETVPDHVFDAAQEVVLVDLPHDELLQRLHEGKVYVPQQAERAIQNFFRKGNLLALRELALRRTADRVDSDVLAYRREQSVSSVWRTQESLLLCIGAGPGGETLVRSAARHAAQNHVPWHAIFIETPALQRLPDAERARVLGVLRLAHDLGAVTATLSGPDVAALAVAYAREQNLGRIMVGRTTRRALPWRRSFADSIGRVAPDLDVLSVAREGVAREVPHASAVTHARGADAAGSPAYLGATAYIAVCTALTAPIQGFLGLTNTVMLFLLVAVLAAWRYGPGPGNLAAVLSVASVDFFHVTPRLSFSVDDTRYAVTFVVMLIVALLVGQLTARLGFQVRVAASREQRMRALFEMARDLSSALTIEQTADISKRFIERVFGVDSTLLLLNAHDRIESVPGMALPAGVDLSVASWAVDHNAAAGLTTDTLPSAPALYVPLRAPMRTRGALAVIPHQRDWLLSPEQERLLETSAALIAIAIERIHFIAVAQDALLHMESERLRNSLLSAFSHDLKTPLTVLAGLSEALVLAGPPLPAAQAGIADSIREEALRTSSLVANLLDMARLQSGDVRLKLEWQPLEEVVGIALRSRANVLARHEVQIDLADDLPLIECDTVLMERVFCNLLENAAKYTAPGSRITIGARADGEWFEIVVSDNGPGLPPGREEALFEKFVRGHDESVVSGVGLGFSIVRAIVTAHRGTVHAENDPQGGARVVIRLPQGTPPPVPAEAP